MATMSVYLAAPYCARELMREYRSELSRIDILVTSSWIGEQHEITEGTIGAATDLTQAQVQKHCLDDFADVSNAAVLVVFTGGFLRGRLNGLPENPLSLHTGGRHVETGYALARRKKVIVVGQPENVFHRGVSTVVPDWHEAVLELIAIVNSLPKAAS